MKAINKTWIFAGLLGLAVYLLSQVYVIVFRLFQSFLNLSLGTIWGVVLYGVNLILQILIISVLTSIMANKFGLELKHFPFLILLLYFCYAVYEIPYLYMFIWTGEWTMFLSKNPAMPSWLASIFITVQYGLVMLITLSIVSSRRKKNRADGDR